MTYTAKATRADKYYTKGKTAIFVMKSSDSKLSGERYHSSHFDKWVKRPLGRIAATWRTFDSCFPSCPFYNDGNPDCYPSEGTSVLVMNRLNKAAKAVNTKNRKYQPMLDEVEAIHNNTIEIARRKAAGLEVPKAVRLHISGEFVDNFDAETVDKSCEDLVKGLRIPMWAYTHAWSIIPADTFKNIKVLASVHSPEEARLALSQGYSFATTFVPEEVEAKGQDPTKAFEIGDGIKVIPCPEQTGKAPDCDRCGLCYKGKLPPNTGIGFAVHARNSSKLKELSERLSTNELPMIA